MRKVVELNSETGYGSVVDHIALARRARELIQFIVSMPAGNVKQHYTRVVVPLCKGALDGSVAFPVHPHQVPVDITREVDQGRVPPEGFERAYAEFMYVALGANVEDKFEKNGKRWGWMEFENLHDA